MWIYRYISLCHTERPFTDSGSEQEFRSTPRNLFIILSTYVLPFGTQFLIMSNPIFLATRREAMQSFRERCSFGEKSNLVGLKRMGSTINKIFQGENKVTRPGNRTQRLHKEDGLHDHYATQASYESKLHSIYVYTLNILYRDPRFILYFVTPLKRGIMLI